MINRHELTIPTEGRGMYEITDAVRDVVKRAGAGDGIAGDALCTVFIHHTSASLILCENADPDVRRDLETFFSRLVPDGDPMFTHTAEGDDDMPSHVRSILTQTSIGLPIAKGRLDLGTWQGLYLWEHRARPHRRRVTVLVTS